MTALDALATAGPVCPLPTAEGTRRSAHATTVPRRRPRAGEDLPVATGRTAGDVCWSVNPSSAAPPSDRAAAGTGKERASLDRSRLTDEELVREARKSPDSAGSRSALDELYGRYYEKVSYWCLRMSGDSQRAGDLAQEVFLRVHGRLDGFRLESRFSTWLYQVTRSVVINRGISENLRRADSIDDEHFSEPAADDDSALVGLERRELADRFREAVEQDLEPLEAKVLYLHHVDGLTMPGITELLGLGNKSGAKAYLVAAKRKLRRGFGRFLEDWRAAEEAGGWTP